MAPRKKCTWSPRKMKIAVKAVQGGAKLRQTAALYNIPVMTLSDYVKQTGTSRTVTFKKMGRKPVFTAQQENEMKEHILLLCRKFYGMTPDSLKHSVFEYAERNKIKNPFNKALKQAGKDWMYGFLKRNPEISIRRPEATSINRILAFNSQEVKLYFDNLTQVMNKHKFPPHRMFNIDETGINNVHRPGKILAAKGEKQVGAATSGERGKTITICCCVSATGHYIPPMIIYPRQRMQAHLERGGPSGTIYKCSKSGWTNEELFQDWMVHFKEHAGATPENPLLLILDNHSSHISLNVYNYCRENGINMVTLPPHTSHRTQPLDLTVFGPLKTALHKECQTYMNLNKYEKLTALELIPLFTKAYQKIANAEKAASGFREAGIWPFDPNVFEQLAEEGNDEPTNEYISAEEAIYDLYSQHVPTNNPDSPQPSTSAQNNPIQLEDFNISQASTPSPINQIYSTEEEVVIYPEPIDDEIECVSKGVESPSTLEDNTPTVLNTREDEISIQFPESINVEFTDIERVRRKILISPGPAAEVAFCTISPMPDKNIVREKGKGRGKRTKQHSIILTSTPMKTVLENKEEKKTIKKEKEAKAKDIIKQNKKTLKKEKNNSKCVKKQNVCVKGKKYSKEAIEGKIKNRCKKRRNYSTSSSEVDENILCDDDDDFDGQFFDEGESRIDELCVICGEFGKNRELWYRCVSCGKWAHALCSGENSANNYMCAFCK